MVKKIVCVIVCVLLASVATAADRYVSSSAVGSNNGTSWANAYKTMDQAISDASATAIHIAKGTTGKYTVTSTSGWAPTAALVSMDVKEGHTVILSGDINGDDIYCDLTRDPCALSNAAASGTHSDNGRILNLSSIPSLTITGIIFDGGTATSGNGGSIAMSGTTNLTLVDCTFQQSYAQSQGGSIYHGSSGTLTVTNCRFTQTSSFNRGGAIHGAGTGGMDISNCVFQYASMIDECSVVHPSTDSASNSITDCFFDQCKMRNNTGGCSGIFTKFDVNSTLTLSNCVFKECNSYHHGAALYARADNTSVVVTANVNNCLVFGSTNWQAGGTNVAFHAECNDPCSVVNLNLTNCTVADNWTNGQGHIGGWVYANDANASATISLKNCVVWANVGGADQSNNAQLIVDTADAGAPRVFLTANYCCWDNSDPNDYGYSQSLGTGNLLKTAIPTLDPLLTGDVSVATYNALALNGYMLDPCSPCIDTGDPTSSYSDEPKCNGGRINMGWLGGTELATPKATTTKLADLDCDNDVDLADFSIMADQWLN